MWPWQWLLFWRGVTYGTVGAVTVLSPTPDGPRPVAPDRMCIASADAASQIKWFKQGGSRLEEVQFLLRCPGRIVPEDHPKPGETVRWWFGNSSREVLILRFNKEDRVTSVYSENLQ